MRIISELALEGEPVHNIGGKDLCALLDLSSGALSELKARGIAVHLAHDNYDLTATVTNYVRHLRGVAAGWGPPDQAADLTAQRARLAREQADGLALKNARARGELVAAEEVERAWGDVLRQVRARIMAVPSRLRADLPEPGPGVIEALDRELRDALSELGHADD